VAYVPLPSWSPSYDPTAVSATAYSTSDAQADLVAAGWVRGQSGWMLPNAKSNYAIKLLSPDETANPVAYQIAVEVAAEWRGLGLVVSLRHSMPPTTRRICQAATSTRQWSTTSSGSIRRQPAPAIVAGGTSRVQSLGRHEHIT